MGVSYYWMDNTSGGQRNIKLISDYCRAQKDAMGRDGRGRHEPF